MKGLPAGETHFRLSVVSSEFEGLTTIKRHKLVYKVTLLSPFRRDTDFVIPLQVKRLPCPSDVGPSSLKQCEL